MKLLTLALLLQDDKEPPKEFRIFPFGEIETSRGQLLFDQQAADQVLAAFHAQGNELSVDYEHQALEWPPIKAPAAGWFALELRADGLWAANVRWTPAAEGHLRAGEYRYFSPAVELEPETGRVLRLINLALTNLPATRSMQPLVAATDKPLPAEKEPPPMKTLLSALGLKDTASEAEAVSALGQLTGRYQQLEQELLKLTGTQTASEAFGTILGLKEAASQVEPLSARVVELETRDREREVEALIAEATREGRMPPVQMGFFRDLGRKDLASLKAYLATAPRLLVTPPEAIRPPPSGPEPVILSETERRTAKQLGLTEAQLLEQKARKAEKDPAKSS